MSGISSLGTLFQLNSTSNNLQKTLNQLASGKSVNSAKDGPAQMALVNSLTSAITDLTGANNNISYSQSSLNTTDSGLSSISESLQNLRSIAVQASNGTLSNNDRTALQQQFDQALQGIDTTAQNTSFNGSNPLSSTASSSALGLSASGVATQSSAQDALAAIDSAIANVNSQRADVGAQSSANQYEAEANSIAAENLAAARSQASDLDYAQATSTLSQQKIQQQAQILALKAGQSANSSLHESLNKLIK